VIRVVLGAYALARKTGFLDTRIGEWFFDHSYFAYKRHIEDPYAALVRRHPELFRDGHILDVGANIGYTASVFARVLTDGFQVYAFEPEQRNWEGLLRNVRRLGLSDKISAVRAAAGNQIGTAQIWANPANHADSRVVTEPSSHARPGMTGLQEVEMMTLDSFVRQRLRNTPIRFVKIDVQSYELAVLKGAQSLLGSSEITVATEVARPDPAEVGSEPDGIMNFLTARSFLPHIIDRRGRIISSDRKRILEISAKRGYTDVIWSRRRLDS
jgi:FkbM family methyltransferase